MSTPHQFAPEAAAGPAVAPAQEHSRGVKRGFWSSLNPQIVEWRGLRVWVIGASSGIGEATAAALQARGAQVLVSARNAASLDAFVKSHSGGAGAQAWPLDVTDAAAVTATAKAILAQGPLDLVLYCAGY